jgi:lipopolysaccharide transport system ATP-binding protein
MEQGAVSEIVSTYLRSGQAEDNSNERVWTDIANAPGTESVRLHRISVQPEDGKPGNLINMQTPLRIEVEYWNLLPAVHLHATLHFYNHQGILAFTSGAVANPDPVLHFQPPIGLFRSVCHIPGNLLNSGFYRVNLLLVRLKKSSYFEMEEAIGFEVVDNAERKYAWFGREKSVLTPVLEWHTEIITPDSQGKND